MGKNRSDLQPVKNAETDYEASKKKGNRPNQPYALKGRRRNYPTQERNTKITATTIAPSE